MSTVNDKATVTLFVNGEQAEDALKRLGERAKELKSELADAERAGDMKKVKQLNRDIDKVNKEINRTETAMKGVGIVMEDLDKTSIAGLKNALRHLQKEIAATKPGTEKWERHAREIRDVKDRIAELNEELKESSSLWDKLKSFADDVWPVFDIFARGYDYVTDMLRGYVDAFADMDQEMANVRKFTGMTAEQVASLNERFKEIDTRSSREQLNRLAQEAGRLGKTSEEDVLGFVRAADKINVALDDLGEGATLTLSKLTGIFGDEARYGTEQALLKVGSVINELSQNCSASAPYIANFSERLGGVASQAGLSIQQIMGFAAVLDSNSQKVEASATALSQVIVRLYQDPAKYARVAGLDIQQFSDLLKEDANAALIMFLESLQKAGGMDVLSPMFKDMGENGSRAIAALSTLATHINEVKAQQEAANLAFEEGISIDDEFAVQNGTVQASLEKCRNRAHELQVQLGEKLQPIIQHLLVSTSAILRAILEVIRFVEQNKVTIVAIATATAAYVTILQLHSLWLDRVAVKTALAETATKALAFAQKALSGVIAVAKVGVAALTNAFVYLKNGLEVTYGMQERWRKAMAGMSFASWTGLILALGTAIFLLYQRTKKMREEAQVVERIRDGAIAKMGEEKSKIDLLVKAAEDERLSLDERKKAIIRLNALIPDYNAQLDETSGKYRANKKALDEYLKSLTRKYELEGAKEQLAEIGKEKSRAAVKLNEAQIYYDNMASAASSSFGNAYTSSFGAVGYTGVDALKEARTVLSEAQAEMAEIEKKEAKILRAYGMDLERQAASESATPESEADPDGGFGDGGSPSKVSDRFAEEKAWRARQEAEARIAYATGEATYSKHLERMAQIATDYNQMLLDREDVVGDERLAILADYYESVNKEVVAGNNIMVEDENNRYADLVARLRSNHEQRLQNEVSSAEELQRENAYYLEVLELAELEHLRYMALLYEEGSADRLAAEKSLQEKEIAARERHLKKMADLEKKYSSMKEKYFGDNSEERQQKYDADFAALQVVYERELAAAGNNADEKLRIEEAFLQVKAALRSQYELDAEEDTRNSMQRAVDSSVEWLNSDGGKAVTGTMSTLVSGMSSIFSGLSSMMQAELEIQTAAINKKYDAEIAAAQGNSYKVAKLEKKKEAEIAKAKNDANKKMFAMQVIQAVAQTAQNALAAYGSAAQVPVVGYILAPIAAAMAVAAGAIQIASIKKQQQASAAQGYSQGGFTKKGSVDEPAGIVHAGEWVASQKLLANPVARPMIEALDQAQRTNTIGSLRAEDVSRSITASQSLARMGESDNSSLVMAAVASRMSSVIADLSVRLNEPFVTVNTVTGDRGMKQAQDEYSRMMNNITPKSKRK